MCASSVVIQVCLPSYHTAPSVHSTYLRSSAVPAFYAPKAVVPGVDGLIRAVVSGDLNSVRALWKPQLRGYVQSFSREDTSHPLLHAAHRLHVEIVEFLLAQGLSPRIRGTVHPYTGDNMTVSELQGTCPKQTNCLLVSMEYRRQCWTFVDAWRACYFLYVVVVLFGRHRLPVCAWSRNIDSQS